MNVFELRDNLVEYLIKNAKVEPLQIVSGVYFLFDRGNVVYVGQSTDVFLRVRQHFNDPAKRFDKWAYLNVAVEDLEMVEREYIDLFQPYLNKTIVRKVAYRRQRPHIRVPRLIAHPSGLHIDINVTDAERQSATDLMAQILRPKP